MNLSPHFAEYSLFPQQKQKMKPVAHTRRAYIIVTMQDMLVIRRDEVSYNIQPHTTLLISIYYYHGLRQYCTHEHCDNYRLLKVVQKSQESHSSNNIHNAQ